MTFGFVVFVAFVCVCAGGVEATEFVCAGAVDFAGVEVVPTSAPAPAACSPLFCDPAPAAAFLLFLGASWGSKFPEALPGLAVVPAPAAGGGLLDPQPATIVASATAQSAIAVRTRETR
ncbi:MAG TPA: hypothetical protein VMV16_03200 [Solirubrobacteraceae bacterium]|nr:hypothetical protein [Solirubrobacteraceae bacterium]